MEEEAVVFRVPAHLAPTLSRFVRGDAAVEVSLEPLGSDGQQFTLIVSDEVGKRQFPAKFSSLPTVVEVYKTADHVNLVKAGAVSRVLVVSELHSAPSASSAAGEDASMVPAEGTVDVVLDPAADAPGIVADPTPGSSELVLESGLTPPMQHAVQRRFRKAQRHLARYDRRLVEEAERVLLDLAVHDAYEHCVEELVDAEAFMAPWFKNGGDNVTITYVDGIATDMYQLQPNVDPIAYPNGISVRVIKKTGELPAPRVVRPNADGTFGDPPGHHQPRRHAHGAAPPRAPPATTAAAETRPGNAGGASAATVLADDDLGFEGGAVGRGATHLDDTGFNADTLMGLDDISAFLGEDGLGLGLDVDDLGDGAGEAAAGGFTDAGVAAVADAGAVRADSGGGEDTGGRGETATTDLETVSAEGASTTVVVSEGAGDAASFTATAMQNAAADDLQAADVADAAQAVAQPADPATDPAAAAAAAEEVEARLRALVSAHPEGQRLNAELAAATAGAAKVADEVAQARKSAELAKGIKALRERWEADAATKGRKLAAFEARVAEATALLEALKESLRAEARLQV